MKEQDFLDTLSRSHSIADQKVILESILNTLTQARQLMVNNRSTLDCANPNIELHIDGAIHAVVDEIHLIESHRLL